MVKKIQKINKPSDSVSQGIRHLSVLIERVDSKVDLIAEQYVDIKKTLDTHTEKLDAHAEAIGTLMVDMQIVKETLREHTKILNRHSERLDDHSEAIGGLAVDLQIVKEDVSFIKGSMKKKIDVEEFTALEQRVSVIEKRR